MGVPLHERLTYAADSTYELTALEREILEHILERDFHAGRVIVRADRSDRFDRHDDLKASLTLLEVGREGLYRQVADWRFGGSIDEMRYFRAQHEALARERSGPAGYVPPMRTLYYPSATPSNGLLHCAALYFDEVHLVHPGRSWAGHYPTIDFYDRLLPDDLAARKRAFYERMATFDRMTAALIQARIVQPRAPVMQGHPRFADLLLSDLESKEFEALVAAHTPEPMLIAGQKLEHVSHLIGDHEPLDLVRDRLKNHAWGSRAYDESPFHARYGLREVNSVIAASILLNHAFLLSEELGFIPVTDSPLYAQLMRTKLDRVAADPAFVDYRRELDLKASSLAMRVMHEYLPRFAFESYEQLLQARERLADPLRAFREAMLQFAAEIAESPYSPTFPRHLENVVATKIRPGVRALQRELEKSTDTFVARVLKNIQQGTIPIVGLLFAGLPASSVIAISAAVVTFEAAWHARRETKAINQNGLSLLLTE